MGVLNIMYIAAKERTSGIGVRHAQGAFKRAILTQLPIESVTICFTGAVAGIPSVWFVTVIVNARADLPPPLLLLGIFGAFAAGALVGIVASVYHV